MALKDRFSQLAALNGGNPYKFNQKSGLRQIGLQNSKGVCQAFCFIDGLLALSGYDRERTKRKDVVRTAATFQPQVESLTGAQLKHWDVKEMRAMYARSLADMGMQNYVRIGYVDTAANPGELVDFVFTKRGYFNLLLPNHVTGYYASGADFRYFDPNFGIVSFTNEQNATNFISDYHGCDDFRTAYSTGTGDVMVVQLQTI